MNDALPCPFCGGKDLEEEEVIEYVRCRGCGATGPIVGVLGMTPALEASEDPWFGWNMRDRGAAHRALNKAEIDAVKRVISDTQAGELPADEVINRFLEGGPADVAVLHVGNWVEFNAGNGLQTGTVSATYTDGTIDVELDKKYGEQRRRVTIEASKARLYIPF